MSFIPVSIAAWAIWQRLACIVFFTMKDAKVTDDLVGSGEFDQSNNTNGNFCLKWSAEELES